MANSGLRKIKWMNKARFIDTNLAMPQQSINQSTLIWKTKKKHLPSPDLTPVCLKCGCDHGNTLLCHWNHWGRGCTYQLWPQKVTAYQSIVEMELTAHNACADKIETHTVTHSADNRDLHTSHVTQRIYILFFKKIKKSIIFYNLSKVHR